MAFVSIWGVGRRPIWIVLSGTVMTAITAAVAALTVKSMLLLAAGEDFRVFYSAGWMLRRATDPYNSTRLFRVMLRVTSGPLPHSLTPFPYLPWFGMIMVPFSLLPYWVAFGLWDTLSFLAVTAAAWWWAHALTWRHAKVAAVVAGFSSVAIFNYALGQVSTMVLALLVGTLIAARADRMGLAGALAVTGALLKPQDLWPVVPLLWVVPEAPTVAVLSRILLGQVTACLVLVGAPLLVGAGLLSAWFHLIIHFGSRLPAQTELVGLPGLLTFAPTTWGLSPSLRDPVVLGLTLLDCVAAVALVRQLRISPLITGLGRERRIGWLLLLPLGIWMVVTPYGHTQDVIVAIPLLMLAMGDPRATLTRPLGWTLLGSVLVVPFTLIFFSDRFYPAHSLAPLGLLVLAVAACRELCHELTTARASAALADICAGCSDPPGLSGS